ncbi:MAG: 4-alpha-glucanotransferase [Polyangia bacterium]
MSSFDLTQRAGGVLLHPTSLPGPHGCGDLGAGARAFADFLGAAGQRWWQLLPINPVGSGNSPYSGLSAFAGSPLLIDLEALVHVGLLSADEAGLHAPSTHAVDYGHAHHERERALRLAFGRYVAQPGWRDELDAFEQRAAYWLPDYALFIALRHKYEHCSWTAWPEPLARRDPAALVEAARTFQTDCDYQRFQQKLFAEQWQALRAYCHGREVGLIGDVPIFVAHDSADVWAHQTDFRLDASGQPTHVAGVPPDYFSATGQRWGNPLYAWKRQRGEGYAWWIERIRVMMSRFDALRLDHFIGFQRYWEIPVHAPTAMDGRWMKGPGRPLFDALREALGPLSIIAEDLGSIDDRVKRLRDGLGLPGMRVLQFAFAEGSESFLPHNYPRRCVAYTGTHDNDTALGWYFDKGEAGMRSPEHTEHERSTARLYLTGRTNAEADHEIEWSMIRSLYASRADLVITPMQDLLALPSSARMNVPGREHGNWTWRLEPQHLTPPLAQRLFALTKLYGRLSAALP